MPKIVGSGSLPGTTLVEDDNGVLREVEERTASRLFSEAAGALAAPTVSAPEGTFAPDPQQLANNADFFQSVGDANAPPPRRPPSTLTSVAPGASLRASPLQAIPETTSAPTVATPQPAIAPEYVANPIGISSSTARQAAPPQSVGGRLAIETRGSSGPPTTTKVTQEFARPISEETGEAVRRASEELAKSTAQGMQNQASALQEATSRYEQAQKDLDRVAAEQAAFDDEFNSRYQQNLTQVNRDITDLSNASINPDRYWKERGTNSKILGGIAVALGALGSSLTGGRNHAWDIISKSIDDDIAAQQHAIATRGAAIGQRMGALGQAMAQYESQGQAYNVARAAAMQRLDLQLQGLERTAGSQEVRDNILNLRNQAQLDAAQRRAQLEQQAAGVVHREMVQRTGGGGGTQAFYVTPEGNRIPITSKDALRIQRENEQQVPVQINGRTVRVPATEAVKIRESTGFQPGDRVWRGVFRTGNAPLDNATITKLQEADAQRLDLNDNLNTIENVRARVGNEQWNTEALGQLRAAYSSAYNQYKEMANLGAIQPQDLPIINGMIPNPEDIDWARAAGRADQIIQSARAARDVINRSFDNRLGVFDLARTGSTAAQTGSSFRRE